MFGVCLGYASAMLRDKGSPEDPSGAMPPRPPEYTQGRVPTRWILLDRICQVVCYVLSLVNKLLICMHPWEVANRFIRDTLQRVL